MLLLGCGSGGAPTPSAAASGLRFAETRLATGVRLRWAERGSPDGEPVIMLHGLTDSWHSFSRVLPELPPRYRMLVPDQRGHGDSERPTSGYAPEDFAADVLALGWAWSGRHWWVTRWGASWPRRPRFSRRWKP